MKDEGMKGGLLQRIQREIYDWSVRNFGASIVVSSKEPSYAAYGTVPAWDLSSLLGMSEELGELNHAVLKSVQGIRGTTGEHRQEAKDAIGDLLIYLLDFCARNGMDAEQILIGTWNKVGQRDWQKDPRTGGEEVGKQHA